MAAPEKVDEIEGARNASKDVWDLMREGPRDPVGISKLAEMSDLKSKTRKTV